MMGSQMFPIKNRHDAFLSLDFLPFEHATGIEHAKLDST
jgi:hypothetical protein